MYALHVIGFEGSHQIPGIGVGIIIPKILDTKLLDEVIQVSHIIFFLKHFLLIKDWHCLLVL